ncbi:MAG: DNA-directed RNA polymerase subunit beta' [Erythrobacter sp.]|uniref:DNA-directed RNA polymerase subunit beta' n=1 Tax=Erythrobacter sp. TaxID=1042 RepID=UPI0026374B16|nr:DNA-directed RNA polymerase subunit beta' [Erythrobacter sp.]MDJ0979413.1 DNA-directed RNA polymerase subunit beta' [Erythrobacter sp.]
MTKPIRRFAKSAAPDHAPDHASASSLIEELARPARLASLGPIAARFLYSLRLIALHERAKRDPVPELAVRLGSVEVAAKALHLSQAIASSWPENVQLSCFCSPRLTHDEATIGALLDTASARDRGGFEAQIDGLIRPARVHRLWEAVLGLVAAEARAAQAPQ